MQTELKQAAAPRRGKVRNKPGVYFRLDASGRRRYEITFRDSDGIRRWRVVPGGLKQAEAKLEELRGRKRRGERVAPQRITFAEAAAQWQKTLGGLRPSSRAAYGSALRVHLLPAFGRLRLQAIGEDDVAEFVAGLDEQGYSGFTVKAAVLPLGHVFEWAIRRGIVSRNPVRGLERSERPAVKRRELRILDRDEIAALFDASERRALLACAVFTGLRLGELLGLTWRDVDFAAGTLHVRRQLDRDSGERVAPKTPEAVRDVILMPALAKLLREQRLRSPFSAEHDLVFPSGSGAGLDRQVARRALARALKAAGVDADDRPRLRFHDLRHTFASLLIAEGSNVVYVSRQLGHANPNITLGVYAHLFDAAEHGERAREALERSFGALATASEGTVASRRAASG